MESIRKKLIDIIMQTSCVAVSSRTAAEHIADNLLDNGVTIQEWAPFAEDPPAHNIPVYTCTENGVIGIGYTKPASASPDGKVHFYPRTGNDVTHWMPLPQLPKEVRKW